MPTFTRSSNNNADGNSSTSVASVTGGEAAKVQLDLTAGKAGTLTTRTDANTGVITSAAHGLTTSDFVSVFWTDSSGVEKYHANMDVTAVTTDTISVDLGQGDDLPAAASTVIVSLVASRVVAWDGTANGMIGFMANANSRRATVTAQAIGTLAGLAGTDFIRQLKSTDTGYMWVSSDGAFTLSGDLLMLTAACGDTIGVNTATFVRLDT